MDILQKLSLTGKSALVTGGARGIGKSVATAFAQAGADVAIVDRDGPTAEATAKELSEATGRRCVAVACDVTKPGEVNAMLAKVLEAYGKLDVAFCNAGICINVPAEDMTPEEWDRVIQVNLTGVFLTAQAAGRQMLKQGYGSIINTASMSAHIVNIPQPQCAYNASKAGVVMLTKSLAIEWAARNVRVNCISPGYIGTEMTAASPHVDEWKRLSPLGRIGSPDELQAICVYLASDASSFTTGADMVVDGGFTSF